MRLLNENLTNYIIELTKYLNTNDIGFGEYVKDGITVKRYKNGGIYETPKYKLNKIIPLDKQVGIGKFTFSVVIKEDNWKDKIFLTKTYETWSYIYTICDFRNFLNNLPKTRIKKIEKMIYDFENSKSTEYYKFKKFYRRLVKLMGFYYSSWREDFKYPEIERIPSVKEIRNSRINSILK